MYLLTKKKIPDYIINGILGDEQYTKILVECKSFDGANYYDIIDQVYKSGIYTIGQTGEYTDEIREIDNNTIELKFTAFSQFILIIRAS